MKQTVGISPRSGVLYSGPFEGVSPGQGGEYQNTPRFVPKPTQKSRNVPKHPPPRRKMYQKAPPKCVKSPHGGGAHVPPVPSTEH